MGVIGEQLSATIRAEANELLEMADSIADDFCEDIVRVLLACQGSVYFSGVGKNGPIAEKIVSTLQSLGVKAYFIDPHTWAHGDVGVLECRDAICLLSKSGKTTELIELCDEARNRGLTTIAITCTKDSELSRHCDFSQALSIRSEASKNCSVPTTSTTAFMAFGDALSLILGNGNSNEKLFLANHPAGEARRSAYIDERRRIKLLLMDVDGTLTDGKLHYGEDGASSVSFSVRDGFGLTHTLPHFGITPAIVSMRKEKALQARAHDLGINLLFLGVKNKLEALEQIKLTEKLDASEIAYIGDDSSDIACMAECGLAACPNDAEQNVTDYCQYICDSKGGEGAVREYIEWICAVKTKGKHV